jgi:hypothetical protein
MEFDLPDAVNLSLRVYDFGRVWEVTTLVNHEKPAGYHSVTWNVKDVASDLYIYKLVAGNSVQVMRMMLVK